MTRRVEKFPQKRGVVRVQIVPSAAELLKGAKVDELGIVLYIPLLIS